MKRNFIYGMVAVASLGLAACTNDELPEEATTPEIEQNAPDSEFRVLQTYNFTTKLGDVKGAEAESRTPGDVDGVKRPSNRYHLNHIHMISLTPKEDAKPSEINKDVHIEYFKGNEEGIKPEQKPQFKKFDINDQKFVLKYRTSKDMWGVEYTTGGTKLNYSLAGTVYFSQDGVTEIPVKLSIFKVSDLESKKQIPLNQFGFGADKELVERHNGTYRGQTLRYTSYDPSKVGELQSDPSQELVGRYVTLPTLEGYDMLKGDFDPQKNLVTECKDEYFSSSEYLVAADQRYVYLLEVVSVENENGGFYQVRKYPRWATPGNYTDVNPEQLSLNRMTSLVNASFMIVDNEEGDSKYYVKNDESRTVENFKNTYGLDLSSMTCPYAALDGVNTRFFINESIKDDKYTTPGRLVLWADGYKPVGVDGNEWETKAVRSMNVNYDFGSGLVHKRGYGIQGNSYSVIFQGSQNDTKSQNIYFWVTIDNVNVKIKAKIPENSGIAFNKNITHQLMVFVPAQKLADTVNSYKYTRSNSNNYLELELPSDCVAFK